MTARKKLIEVALPLDAINVEAAREKSIRHGHPSTLHLWWARRPLAACRAVLFASLVDDPGNDLPDKEAEAERKRLFGIIEQLVLWKNVNDERVLHAARTEIARSVARTAGVTLPPGELTPGQVREALEKYAPPVLDPFAGGGSIPLEVQRLGLKAYASDLNPVAILINKALIEIPQKFAGKAPVHPDEGQMALGTKDEERKTKTEKRSSSVVHPLSIWKGAAGLAEDVRYYGAWMLAEAEKRIGRLYPKGPKGETVIAWLWARTVKCPNPACEIDMPLARGFVLMSRRNRKVVAVPEIDREAHAVTFKISNDSKVKANPVLSRTGAICVSCKRPIDFSYIREEGIHKRLGYQLIALVAEGADARHYHPASKEHVRASISAKPLWRLDADLPNRALGFRVQRYGMTNQADLYMPRQMTMLTTFAELVNEVRKKLVGVDEDYANAVATYLALAVSRSSSMHSSLSTWNAAGEFIAQTFVRQALSMTWDFAEANPFSNSTGSWMGAIDWIARVLVELPIAYIAGHVYQLDAASALPPIAEPMIATDPPYYDNIGYAALSDYYYVWLRYMLNGVYPDLFSTLLTPKAQEIIAEPGRFDGDMAAAEHHFEVSLGSAFGHWRKNGNPQYPTVVYYAFKQEETDDGDGEDTMGRASTGWETMLEGLIQAEFQITGTLPMRTERSGRPRGFESNALASSIVLVCRPRPESAPLATRREFINAIKKELPAALTKLMHGGIAPVDLAQAAIGPGMAVFSRYAKVLEADGSPMPVRTALQLINQHLDEHLTAEDSDLDKDTRFALAWFQQFGHDEGSFGDADVLARAKDTSVAGLAQAGILYSRGGKVRLLRREELAKDWDPRLDARLTVWECAQQLIRRLNEKGEEGAAALVKNMGGGRSEDARALAYRLYAICERKKWADEALAYNSLVVSWPEIEKNAASMEGEVEQGKLL